LRNCFQYKHIYLQLLIGSTLLILLSACTTTGPLTKPAGNPDEYRREASRAIHEKRYSDAVQQLRNVIALDPTSSDFLLLGDLQEALERYRPARRSYLSGLEQAAEAVQQHKFIFHLAVLEGLHFNDYNAAASRANQLPDDTAEDLVLETLLAMLRNHYDKSLELSDRVIKNNYRQEMIGWAHYLAARSWVAVGNDSKAFQALFFAINHARGYGLVARITRLWEDLKQRPLSE
jgi:tetratricopeptide (TPR) repeat protein